MKKAFIFDIDGTLLDTEKIYIRAWILAGENAGYTIPKEALIRTRAVRKSVAEKIYKEYCGEDFPYEALLAERVRIAEEIIQNTAKEDLLMEGAIELLLFLKNKGYPLAAASSTPYQITAAHLRQTGLDEFFHAVICGDMVQNGKPAPDIFLKAAEKIGADPKDCFVVGDTPADVVGGSAAGMKVFFIPDLAPSGGETNSLAYRVLKGLSEIPSALNE